MQLNLFGTLRLAARQYCRNEDGSPLIETAIMAPVLIGMMMAVFEVSQLVLAYQKVASVAATMADMTARSEFGLKESELADFFEAVPNVAENYDFETSGRVVITAVIGRPGGNEIVWQRCGGGNGLQTSQLGGEGAVGVTLPGDIMLDNDSMAIVAEAFLEYQPILNFGLIEGRQIRETVIFRPRFGALTSVENDIANQATCS